MTDLLHDPMLMEAGDQLTRDEFLRCWEAMPDLKRAELIGGVVYMPSPLSWPHGVLDNRVGHWLGHYALHTPGCEAGNNATWLMGAGDDAPQPDISLRILPEYGGRSRMEGRLAAGTPEFLAEICLSSRSYDLHAKRKLYESSGVQEYLAVLVREREVRWHRLVNGTLGATLASEDGVLRSVVFPGLWLDGAALLAGDLARVLAVLQQGLATPEHAAFVERLDRQRR